MRMADEAGDKDARTLRLVLSDGINSLPSGLALFDAQDRLVIANSVFREMLPTGADLLDRGATFEEMARHNAKTYFGIPEADVDSWLATRLQYRKSASGVFDQMLKDGRWFRIQESRTSDGGTVTHWTDITDLKKEEQTTDKYMQALRSKNEELMEFAYVASHDLQEPLRKIEAFGQRLSEQSAAGLDERGRMFLDRILDATSRMRALITGLLDYSKADHSAEDFETVSLQDIVSDALDSLEFAIKEKSATIDIGDLPQVKGDRGMLFRLFLNLISNAVKYTADDVQPRVAISARQTDDGFWAVDVTDNGIGFDASEAEPIFRIFHRLHPRSAYAGTGIGLATCRKIATRHGGAVSAVSEPGRGSTFTITLPV